VTAPDLFIPIQILRTTQSKPVTSNHVSAGASNEG
jgi:hypothetical protein